MSYFLFYYEIVHARVVFREQLLQVFAQKNQPRHLGWLVATLVENLTGEI